MFAMTHRNIFFFFFFSIGTPDFIVKHVKQTLKRPCDGAFKRFSPLLNSG